MSILKFSNNIAIVIVTYNRPASLNRLLGSLDRVNYYGDTVDLIISIDFSGNNSCNEISENFNWNYGNKLIVQNEFRLGLRSHIMSLGKFFLSYDYLIILEDDLLVSPNLYNYALVTTAQFNNSDFIAGISLYAPHWCESSSRPFIPSYGSYDVYLMQYAQSWGQIWFKEKWFRFIEWYEANKNFKIEFSDIPENIANWPDSSWLKYHIKYCVDNNKYFVYPYISLTTNFTEIGEHNDSSNTTYQVALCISERVNYTLPSDNSLNQFFKYDVFHEFENLGNYLNIENNDLCVDLYGIKPFKNKSRYLISISALPYRVVKSFGLSMRPHEANIIFNIPGEIIFLYDTFAHEEKPPVLANPREKFLYDVKFIDYKLITYILLRKLIIKLKPSELKSSFIFWCKKIFFNRRIH
jgi:hypothetical protein